MDGLYIIGLNDQNIEFDPDQLCLCIILRQLSQCRVKCCMICNKDQAN